MLMLVAVFFTVIFGNGFYSRAYPHDPKLAKILEWWDAHDQGSRWTTTGRAICEEAYGALNLSASEIGP